MPTPPRRSPRSCGGSWAARPSGSPTARPWSVTLSAGVAGGLGGVLRPDALVRDADAALYSAKALGRDQVYVFRETGDEGTIRRAPIAAEARTRALDVGREAMAAARMRCCARSRAARRGPASRPR